jgi:hypothetical protein
MGVRRMHQSFDEYAAEIIFIGIHDYPYLPPDSVLRICQECGGEVKMLVPDGDFREIVKGGLRVFMPIPASVLIPKCTYCGETYFGYSDVRRIEEALGADDEPDQ